MKLNLAFLMYGVLTIFILNNSSCKKDEQYMSNAKIVGLDYKMCPCCGGMEITIDNVANPNGSAYFLVEELPSNFSLGDNPKFPIAIKFDWRIDTAHCFGNYIDISKIARR